MAILAERWWSANTQQGEAWVVVRIDDVAWRVVSTQFFNPSPNTQLNFTMTDDRGRVNTVALPANMTQPQTVNVPNNRDYTFTIVQAFEDDGSPAVDDLGNLVFERRANFKFSFVGPIVAARRG